jgi:hypothetical protein
LDTLLRNFRINFRALECVLPCHLATVNRLQCVGLVCTQYNAIPMSVKVYLNKLIHSGTAQTKYIHTKLFNISQRLWMSWVRELMRSNESWHAVTQGGKFVFCAPKIWSRFSNMRQWLHKSCFKHIHMRRWVAMSTLLEPRQNRY